MKKERRYCSKTSRYNKAFRMKILSILLNVLTLKVLLCPAPSFSLINRDIAHSRQCHAGVLHVVNSFYQAALLCSARNVSIIFEMLPGLGLN